MDNYKDLLAYSKSYQLAMLIFKISRNFPP
jgi:hypothetical protein